MKQFLSFVRKEFYHIFRDSRTMLILLVMPIVMIILFGYAVTNEVKNTRVAILDMSKDEMSRKIIERVQANTYFHFTQYLNNEKQVMPKFRSGEIDMVLVFNEGFSSELKSVGRATIQMLIDGSEPNQASIRAGYMTQLLMSYQQEQVSKSEVNAQMNIDVQSRMLYNPQQKSEYNFVPGVIGMIILLLCTLMTSIAIVREKEMGTMEVLLASPLPPIYIIISKLLPYMVLSIVNLITILLLSKFMLCLPMSGNIFYLLGVSLIYIIVGLALGLFISTCVSTQLAAMLLSLLVLVPTVYLSGMVFPVESMPEIFQNVSMIVPARWYVDAARKLMIQGVDARYVLKDTFVLCVMAFILIVSSLKLFKTRL